MGCPLHPYGLPASSVCAARVPGDLTRRICSVGGLARHSRRRGRPDRGGTRESDGSHTGVAGRPRQESENSHLIAAVPPRPDRGGTRESPRRNCSMDYITVIWTRESPRRGQRRSRCASRPCPPSVWCLSGAGSAQERYRIVCARAVRDSEINPSTASRSSWQATAKGASPACSRSVAWLKS